MSHAVRYEGDRDAPLGPLVRISCDVPSVGELSGTAPWSVDNFHDLVAVDCPFCDDSIILEAEPATVRMFRRWAGDIADEARPPVQLAAPRDGGRDRGVDVFARAAGCVTGEQADEWRLDRQPTRPDGPTTVAAAE